MLQKNEHTLVKLCEVEIKNTWGNAFPQLAAFYTTLSKITWRSSPGTSAAGVEYDNRVSCSYPGLSKEQFAELDKFLKGMYEVRVTTDTGNRYQVSGPENPMRVDLDFNDGETEITFRHTAIEPIKFLGNTEEEAQEQIGFPYNLTFTLA